MQRRAVLGLLLVERNNSVSVDRICWELWHDRPPPSAKTQLQGHICALRQALAPRQGDVIVTTAHGYLLRCPDDEFDAAMFAAETASARSLLAAGDLAAAAELFDAALARWTGPAFADVSSESTRAVAVKLDESRLTATCDRIEAGLALGHHGELTADINRLVTEHPYWENPRWLQMRAFQLAGRRADALAAYRSWRQLCVDEHGLEPGARVRELHESILRDEDSAAQGPNRVPAQLSMATAGHVGRVAELRALDETVPDTEATGTSVVLVVGPPGVGKTALATHWAHRVARSFPDGQFYLELHGYSASPPLRPAHGLGRLLRSLGVPAGCVPVDEEEAAAMLRTELAGKRVLIFLDNASSVEQVQPLLPPGGGSLALITSRDKLTGLVAAHGAQRIELGGLVPAESAELIGTVLGRRATAEPAAVRELCELCGQLPLALRIAAAKLQDDRGRTVADYCAELRRGGVLEPLAIGGGERLAVKAAFDLSYNRSAPEVRRVFHRLGLSAGLDIGVAAVAALAGTDECEARRCLDLLVSTHLVERAAAGRYRLHDLLRRYATDRALTTEPADDRERATRNLLGWYLAAADTADRLILPLRPRPGLTSPRERGIRTEAEAVAWFDAERGNLLAAVRHALWCGMGEFAWRLPAAALGFYCRYQYWAELLDMATIGLEAADGLDDGLGRACMLTALAIAHNASRQFAHATEHYHRALVEWKNQDEPEAEGLALTGHAVLLRDSGRHTEAVAAFQEALTLQSRVGDTWTQAITLHNLGDTYRTLRRFGEAFEHYETSLDIRRALRDRHGEAWVLHDLGRCHLDLGQPGEATSCLERALGMRRELRDRRGTVNTLLALADAAADRDEPAVAAEYRKAADLLNSDPSAPLPSFTSNADNDVP